MIPLLLATLAAAEVLRVPEDYATLQDALLAAGRGDVIELDAGDWSGPFVIHREVTIRGAGPGQTVLSVSSGMGPTVQVQPAGQGQVVLEELTLRCGSHGVVDHTAGALTLSGIELGGCSSSTSSPAIRSRGVLELTLEGAVFRGGASSATWVDVERGGRLELAEVAFDHATIGGSVVRMRGDHLVLRDLAFSRLTASGALIVGEVDRAELVRVSLACNTSDSALVAIYARHLQIDALLAWKNSVPAGVPAIALAGDVRLGFATLLGAPGDTLLALQGAKAGIQGLAMGEGVGVDFGEVEALDLAYSVLAVEPPSGAVGPGVIAAAPELWSVSPSPACGGDVLAPRPGGNLVDAGPPDLQDRDGTAADVGATGGPEGFLLRRRGDCGDPEDTTDPSQVDPDCVGHMDPTGPLRPRGCGHTPTGGAVGGALCALLITRVRRACQDRRL